MSRRRPVSVLSFLILCPHYPNLRDAPRRLVYGESLTPLFGSGLFNTAEILDGLEWVSG